MSQDGASAPGWGSSSGGWGNPAPTPGPAPTDSAGQQGIPLTGNVLPGSVLPGGGGSGGVSTVSAPTQWLMAAAGLELVGLVLGALASGKPALSVAGWVLSGFGALGLLAVFTLADSRRRADPWYSSGSGPAALRGVLAITSVLVVALNAYQFADWISRR